MFHNIFGRGLQPGYFNMRMNLCQERAALVSPAFASESPLLSDRMAQEPAYMDIPEPPGAGIVHRNVANGSG
jgi:hypothetical protein